MKKFSKVFTVIAAVLCAAVLLTACGGVKGTYVATREQDGVTLEATIELKGGDKATLTSKVIGELPDEMKDMADVLNLSYEATYKVDGEKITITATVMEQTSTQEGTIKDGVITIAGIEYKKK